MCFVLIFFFLGIVGSTIIDYVTSEIISLFECESGSEEEAEYKNTLIDALTLLNIFEKAGDSLSLYCSSMQKSVSRLLGWDFPII